MLSVLFVLKCAGLARLWSLELAGDVASEWFGQILAASPPAGVVSVVVFPARAGHRLRLRSRFI